MKQAREMRLAIYCDHSYRLHDGALTAELPFAVFLGGLADYCSKLTLVGRLDDGSVPFPHPLGDAEFMPLPHYSSGTDARSLIRAMPVSAARFWRLLGRVDAAWVLGPTPLSVVFALLTLLRRRQLILGVRQDLPSLFEHRYPDRPLLRLGARALEAASRTLARRVPVVVVGPDLARHYGHSRALHTLFVSLLSEEEILPANEDRRRYDGPALRLLSVGRIDSEKNPLLLADVLARLFDLDSRWQMDVCGDGPLLEALRDRLEDLGIAAQATLHGHLAMDTGLLELYRRSHVLLHVSFSEGVPQVLLEALASRLPVVATGVGGVPDLIRDCGLLIPPADVSEAVTAVKRMASDSELRAALVQRGAVQAQLHSRERESAGLVNFLAHVSGADA